jgi:acetyl esterase/lipase
VSNNTKQALSTSQSWQSHLLNLFIRLRRAVMRYPSHLTQSRKMTASLHRRWAKRVNTLRGLDSYRCGDINVDRYTPQQLNGKNLQTQKVLLFLHGGGYCLRLPNVYKKMLADYSEAIQCIDILPDYRLAPEHPHPCGIEDCLNTYQNLLAQGYCPENIIILGDSAGGGLSLSVIQRVQRQMPAAAVLLSPAGDWSLQGASYFENEDRDPFFRLATFLFFRSLYLNGYSSTDPNVSPVYGDFSNFPPTLLLSSSTELMRDTAVLIDKNIRTAGGHSTLHITQNACHDYPLFDFLPEAKIAKQKIFSFCNAIFSKTALPD